MNLFLFRFSGRYWRRFRTLVVVLVFAAGVPCMLAERNIEAADMTGAECMADISDKIQNAPLKQFITTLDGQHVDVQAMVDFCNQQWPECILYEKFYHWKSETKSMSSRTTSGMTNHSIRIYYNPMSVCYPSQVHPGRTHGDVAEFYDGEGKFMGIAVYMGKGQYFPIPYPAYHRQDN